MCRSDVTAAFLERRHSICRFPAAFAAECGKEDEFGAILVNRAALGCASNAQMALRWTTSYPLMHGRRDRAQARNERATPQPMECPPMTKRGERSMTNVAAAAGGKRGVVAVYTPPEEPRREPIDPEALFRVGLRLFERNQRSREAAVALERAHRLKPSDPRYASYYGLSLACSTNRLKDAETLCTQAVALEFCRPELFHNLGRVRLLLGDRQGAHAAFNQGLSVDRNDERIQQEIAKLGIRKRPVIGFLSRRHPLNKYIGLLCSQISKQRSRG